MKKVRKAIIPATGRGTRFLPATKTKPKEMLLPIVDKLTIQYIAEKAVDIEKSYAITMGIKKLNGMRGGK